MGNRLNYCQTPCPTVRTTDPRVRVDPPHSNALVSLQGNALDLPHGGACGARVAFSCPECYRVVGSVSAECLPNSTWSHPAPSCSAVTCSPPLQINSGLVPYFSCQTEIEVEVLGISNFCPVQSMILYSAGQM